jgi:hypothetical protein
MIIRDNAIANQANRHPRTMGISIESELMQAPLQLDMGEKFTGQGIQNSSLIAHLSASLSMMSTSSTSILISLLNSQY